MSRHNISDKFWQYIEPLVRLPRKEERGRPSKDNRLMLNGILWILRTGDPWRDLPYEFGPWQTVYKRFNTWAKLSCWNGILDILADDADLESIMVDGSTHVLISIRPGAQEVARPRPLTPVVED